MANLNSVKTISGIDTNSNPSSVPNNLQVADNAILNRTGAVSKRRGFDYYFQPGSHMPTSIWENSGQICYHSNETNQIAYGQSQTLLSGTYPPPSSNKIRSVAARGNLYMTTANGIYKQTSYNSTPFASGTPAALDLAVSNGGTTAGWLGASQVAYRVTWVRTDANQVQTIGAPSQPYIFINNSGSTIFTTLTFTVPWGCIAGDSFQVWRTATSATTGTYPGDLMYLVAQSSTWTMGTPVTYNDTTVNASLSSTPLYTNSTAAGIANANYPPPYALDLESYRDYIFYANVYQPQQFSTQMLGVANLVNDVSSITFSNGSFSETYTYSSAENQGALKFALSTGGTSSSNIWNTTQSLIRIINRNPTGKLYAEYTSGVYDLPGKMRIWARDLSTTTIYMTCNTGTTGADWSPTVPTSGTTVASDNGAHINRFFFSQYAQPEAVALGNYMDVGSSDSPILRIIALVNSLIIIKDEGLWFISGLSAPWTLSKLNISTKCVAANSVVSLNNKVFMLTNQGVVMASEAGVQIISFPIENQLRPLYNLANLASVCHGVGWESDRVYILWMPTTGSDTYGTQAFVYNFLVSGWTRWDKPACCGLVEKYQNNLYISSGVEKALLVMNNTNTNADFNDETHSATLVSGYPTELVVTYSGSIKEGYGISQGSNIIKVISAIMTAPNHWVVVPDIGFSTWSNGSACSIKTPIYSRILFHPNTCGEAGVTKLFLDVNFIFEMNSLSMIYAIIQSNTQPGFSLIPYSNTLNNGWGMTTFGAVWGNPINVSGPPFRIIVPQPHTSGESLQIGFNHSVSNENFALLYTSILYDQLTLITNSGRW